MWLVPLLAAAACAAIGGTGGDPVCTGSVCTAGQLRVHALSKTLLRLEPKGPRGWEDRPTFFAVDRTPFPGLPITGHAGPGPASPSSSAAAAAATFTFATSVWTLAVSCSDPQCADPSGISASVRAAALPGGATAVPLWAAASLARVNTTLWWPSPLESAAYAVADGPRFVVPPWGAAPAPPNATVDPALLHTNGYDLRNDVEGDTYVFLLGGDLAGWHASRREFLALTGPTPPLPDWAFGTWYSYYRLPFGSEAQASLLQWCPSCFAAPIRPCRPAAPRVLPRHVMCLAPVWRPITTRSSRLLPDAARVKIDPDKRGASPVDAVCAIVDRLVAHA